MAGLDFGGRSVVVTGGSGGIGNAVARAFRDAGAAVVATGTRPAGSYDSDLSGMTYRQLDVGDEAAVRAFAAGLPRVDVLVNNAGMVAYRRQEFEPATFRRVLDVNLGSVLQLSTLLHERLKASRGSIINLASLAGFFGTRGNPAYGASKAAIVQMTKSLAVAWGRDGIRVNAIAPGWVVTKMTAVSHGNQAIHDAAVARTPLGRWGTPEDIAGVALFLASDLARYVTGETILADGGYSAAV